MGNYIANSSNSINFIVTENNLKLGELNYRKWYTFDAEIVLDQNLKYQLVATKRVDEQKIELIQNDLKFAEFKMGRNGIIIKTFFENIENCYVMKHKGKLNSKFILTNIENHELIVAIPNFKWKTLNYNYNIETAEEFDNLPQSKLLLFTVLHCLNYYMIVMLAPEFG